MVPVIDVPPRDTPVTQFCGDAATTALRDQRLTDFEARLRLEDSVLPDATAVTGASVLLHSWL